MSERRSRGKGRGIDGIFDSADLTLTPTDKPSEPSGEAPRTSAGRGPEVGETRVPAWSGVDGRRGGRGVGRPRGQVSQDRELIQRGFYLEATQDRMLDEIKAALKGRGFTPDRSAIVRAALTKFSELEPFDQEELVRRNK
ncbi:MAG: hypothetical protein M3475_06725 [Actinomycetota bacterium]|nr:hypothetical protein [Actinomycetota bacterium]